MSETYFTPAQLSALTKLDAPRLAAAVKAGYVPKPTADGYPQAEAIRGAFAYLDHTRDTWRIEDISDITGWSRLWFRQLADRGFCKPPRAGTMRLRETIEGMCKFLRERAAKKEPDKTVNRRDAKLDKQNKLLDIAIAQAEHKVIDFGIVEQAWSEVLLTAKARLRQIGSKVTPRLKFLQTENQQQAEIEREIDDVLTELSKPVNYKWNTEAVTTQVTSEEVETKSEE